MLIRRASLVLGALCLLAVGPASGLTSVKAAITCPASAQVGENLGMNVHLQNDECAPATVRLITSIAGNANQSLGGLGVFGPLLAQEVVVPAATCSFPFTTGVLDLVLDGPLAVPAAHVGTVELHVLLSE